MKLTTFIMLGMCGATVFACDDSAKRSQEKADQARITAGEVAREGQEDVNKKAAEANDKIHKANEDAIQAQRKAEEARVATTSELRTKVANRITELEKDAARFRAEVKEKTGQAKSSSEESLAKTEVKLAKLREDVRALGTETRDGWDNLKARVEDDLRN